MSKSERVLSVNSPMWHEPVAQPLLVLEKQLMNTLELRWHVLHATIHANDGVSRKTSDLLERMAGELKIFSNKIRKRLEFWRIAEANAIEPGQRPYMRLLDGDDLDIHEQLEGLLCGYARYERNTREAKISLELSGDLESADLLEGIMRAVERCLCYLEIYLEGLALNYTDPNRLPDFPVGAASEAS